MEPGKRKGKPKEIPEQRHARLEMEALAATEEEGARQAAASAQLREAAAREAAMSAVNSRRLNAEWVQRMRGAKLEELQGEARVLSRQHDAAVDRRDRLAEALLEDLAAQNAQHDAAAAAHSRVLEELLDLHRERMAALHAQFSGDLRVMQAEFEGEKAEMASLHHRTKKELVDIMVALQQSYADTRTEAAASYRLQEEEVRNRASEAYNVTKLSLGGRARELEGLVKQQHQSYEEATGEQDEAYRKLVAADAEAEEAIAQRTDRLRHLQQTLVQWRGCIVANSSEWQRRNSALAREKEIVLGHHTALKGALAKFRAAQEARLKQMCVSYATVEAGLREHLATAQRIVRLARLCCKHELPGEVAAAAAGGAPAQQQTAAGEGVAEHIVEFRSSTAGADAGESSRPASSSQHGHSNSSSSTGSGGDSSLDDALAELGLQPGSSGQHLLDAFVCRMNRAVLDTTALEHERLRLTAENTTLRAVLKAVQEGTRVGPAAVEAPLSTLLVVNERLQRELRGAAMQRRGSCSAAQAAGQ